MAELLLLLFLVLILLLTSGLRAGCEWRWLVRMSAGGDVSEEAEEVRKDLIDVAEETGPGDEQVATASKRRPEDTACAFIVLLVLLLVLASLAVYRQTQQQLSGTNRARAGKYWVRACPPASFSSLGPSLLAVHGSNRGDPGVKSTG